MIETRIIVHGLKAHLFGKPCAICDEVKETTTKELTRPNRNKMMTKSRSKKVR